MFFSTFSDLKERKKKSFHFSEQHQHRAEKPVGWFLPNLVLPVNQWQNLCPGCAEAFFLFAFVLCQGRQLVQLNRYAPPTSPPPPEDRAGRSDQNLKFPGALVFAH